MNKNMNAAGRPEKAYLVLSIRDINHLLKCAMNGSRASSSHPGKVNPRFCVALTADLAPVALNDSNGAVQISSQSLLESADRYNK